MNRMMLLLFDVAHKRTRRTAHETLVHKDRLSPLEGVSADRASSLLAEAGREQGRNKECYSGYYQKRM